MTLFYDHIVVIHEVHSEVESLPLDSKEKKELVELIEETIHHKVIHKILDHLHEDHHEHFLDKFHKAPHDESLLSYLKEQIHDIEQRIKDVADEVKYELLKTIRDKA